MGNFEDKIRKIMEERPALSPDEGVWNKILLDNFEKNKGFKKNYYWSAAAIIFLLGLWGAFHLGQKSVHPFQVDKVMNENAIQPGERIQIVYDTILRVDTVERLVFMQVEQSKKDATSELMSQLALSQQEFYLEKLQFLKELKRPFRAKGISSGLTLVDNILFRDSPILKSASQIEELHLGQINESKYDSPFIQSLAGLYGQNLLELPVRSIGNTLQVLDYAALIKISHKGKNWKRILPDYIRAGMEYSPLFLNDQLHELSYTQIAIPIEFGISPRIAFQTKIGYRKLRAEIENSSPIPIPDGLSETDRIREIKMNTSYLDIPIGIKIGITQNNLLRSYIQTGVLFTQTRQQNYSYEITRQNNRLKLDYEMGQGEWFLNALLLGTGVEYSPVHRLATFLELEAKMSFHEKDEREDRINGVGIKAGVLYTL